MNYSLTLSGSPYTLSTSDAAQIAAITACRTAYNVGKEEADQLVDDAAYLQFVFGHWADANPGFTNEQLQSAAASAFASYANQNPPEQVLEQPLTGDALKTALKAYAAAKRYQVETGGMTVNGVSIPTDRITQSKLSGCVVAFQAGALTGSIDWKADSGWISVDQATITALASAVAVHVQASFTAERAVSEAIDAGTITSQAQVDAYAWPT